MVKVFCIGDSHVSVFLGFHLLAPIWPEKRRSLLPDFEVIRLGAVTAYNICEINSSSEGRKKLELVLKQIPKDSWIIISAGEVDCRSHLIKQAEIQNISYETVARIAIERYLNYLVTIKKEHSNICLLLPPPTGFLQKDDPSYPKYGSETERNLMTNTFNDILSYEGSKVGIPSIEVFKEGITAKFNTKHKYLWDGIHLSTYPLPSLVFQLKQVTKLKLKLPLFWWLLDYSKRMYRLLKR